MKKILYILFLLPMVLVGQTATENYIKTKSYKTATISSIATPTLAQAVENITYFDGLGRPIQQLAKGQSATGKNIVTHMEYDALGRQVKEYLPYCKWYAAANLDYTSVAQWETMAYYGTYDPNVTGNLTFEQTANPLSEKELEASPLNRVFKQGAPGNDWAIGQGNEVKFDYQANDLNEVKLFIASSNFSGNSLTLINGAGTTFYPEGELFKTITKNENWKTGDGNNNTTEEFKDTEGKVVMKRTYGVSVVGLTEIPVWHETYYVYDQYGNLTYVIPPLAEGTLSNPATDELCYHYKYDYRNRLIEKKLPGKQWEFMVYDKLDRVVATGPALYPFINTPPANTYGWMITKYDVFGRVIYTGWEDVAVSSGTRVTKQNTQNGIAAPYEVKQSSGSIDGISAYYSNAKAPTVFKLLTVNYYDDYIFPNPPAGYGNVESQPVYYNTTVKPKGLATGSWVRALTTLSSTAGESSYTLYDKKSRPLRTYTTNYLGGYTQIDTNMDSFSGRVNYTVTKHKRITTDIELYIKDSYTYTDQDRVLTHIHQIGAGGTPQLLQKNSYDELGQLISKQVGGANVTTYLGLQKVDYRYNIRGWLMGINDVSNLLQVGDPEDFFAFGINYNKPVTNTVLGTIKPLFNGNIAETNWRTKNDNLLRRYGYSYDALNRLKKAVYQKGNASVQVTNSYNERLDYDKNGNIISLQRTGEYDDAIYSLPIDNLTYTYHSNKKNQLMKVEDASINPKGFKDDTAAGNPDDYSYDSNGNMLTDLNKGISGIKYNHLNLPFEITFGTIGTIEYLYDANGKKLAKKVTQDQGTSVITTDYLDGFQYIDENLNFFPHAEGYVKVMPGRSGWRFSYVFNYTDHLGNVRVSYGVDPDSGVLTILEENNYYPYGLKHQNYNMTRRSYVLMDPGTISLESCTDCPYKYKYNGKEYQDELGLNMYDYGARNYDPAIGRWMNIDPLAEQYRRWSPYTYCVNNPIIFTDPDGMGIDTDFYNLKGNQVKHVDDGKADKKLVLTTASGEKAVDKAIGKGEVVAVPSNEVINKMDEAYNSTEQTGNEHGFVVATDGTTSSMKEGKTGDVKLGSRYRELNDADKTTSYDVHTHPNVSDASGQIVNVGTPSPSGEKGDIGSYGKDGANDSPSVVLGYDVTKTEASQIRTSSSSATSTTVVTKQVGFYNSNGQVGKPVDYNQLKKAADKINNPKQ